MNDKPLKEINTVEYMKALCSIVEQGQGASTIVTGSSMAPFLISNKSSVYLQKPERKLKKGDVVLYIRSEYEYILHRIYRVDGEFLYFVGDAQSVIEGPLPKECVKGVVTKYKRRKKWCDSSSFIWIFYSKVWIDMLWARPLCMKIYFGIRKIKHKFINKISK